MGSLVRLTRPIEGQRVFAAVLPDYDMVRHCVRCALKDYAELLHDDRDGAARARAFSARVKDVHEWYDETLPTAIGDDRVDPLRVAVHDACHLANAQGVRQPQRRLLKRVPAIHIVEMEEPSACCGSAGIYNITHPAMSDKRLERKLHHIADTGASDIAVRWELADVQRHHGR